LFIFQQRITFQLAFIVTDLIQLKHDKQNKIEALNLCLARKERKLEMKKLLIIFASLMAVASSVLPNPENTELTTLEQKKIISDKEQEQRLKALKEEHEKEMKEHKEKMQQHEKEMKKFQ
jgi:hypothetical protein